MHDGFEFLLITSRETGRWIVPKGWPMKGKKPHACAAREALEEAGVKGKIDKSAIGCYRYVKRLSNNASAPCIVDVYPLMVERQMAAEASSRVNESELASLIEIFAARLGH
jgi:8-oxo-dGTP pyrophosphatase MutT (NUDIX family)